MNMGLSSRFSAVVCITYHHFWQPYTEKNINAKTIDLNWKKTHLHKLAHKPLPTNHPTPKHVLAKLFLFSAEKVNSRWNENVQFSSCLYHTSKHIPHKFWQQHDSANLVCATAWIQRWMTWKRFPVQPPPAKVPLHSSVLPYLTNRYSYKRR